MFSLTRKQAQELLDNPEALVFVTKKRWQALKEFVESDNDWARDFQPKSLGPQAWTEFGKRLKSAHERLHIKS